ncbi:phage tail tube protein [Lactobacillus intestinalis]|uniref:phage tail tube protein n=1 Tax=Lactobacillus intestinalis TaxID=151781 RepID=UPI00262F7DAC|nr:phage tail tube protein [Lactobacillus intestinalis]
MAEVQALPGKRMVSYFRLLKNANKEDAELVPLEGDSSLSLKRDTKSVTTKSGNISTSSGLTTEIDQTFYEGISKVSDEFYDAILEDQTVEYWLVDLDRQNSEGKFWSIYARARVTEDKPSFKADSTAERSPKMSVIGTPKRGYTALSDYDKAMIDYAFRGIGKIAADTKEDGTDGNGTPYDGTKALEDKVPTETIGEDDKKETNQ